MNITPSKATGALSVLAGITACICIVNVVAAFMVAPIGIVSGGIAVHKRHGLLGWIGIGLSILAPLITVLLLWRQGWLDGSSSGD